MQIGCHGLVWAGSFEREALASALSRTHAAGFDAFELPLMNPAAFDLDGALEVIEAAPVKVVAASLGQSRDSDPSLGDPESFQAGLAKIGRALEIVQALGAPYLVGVLYGELRKYTEPITDAQRADVVDFVRRIADDAGERGIELGLEVVNRYESNHLNTGRQALDFIDRVDRPNVKVHLDTYHMNIEESDMAQPVLDCGDRLGYVHVGESHRGYLGSGTVDYMNFFHALDRINYDGPITFETFSTAIIHEDLSRMLAVWRNLWEDSEDLALRANQFIRAHYRAAQTTRMH
ncbi:MAG: sugar phosphate isomerase/epimerase family protein [Beutenbergiaceae bacterium]